MSQNKNGTTNKRILIIMTTKNESDWPITLSFFAIAKEKNEGSRKEEQEADKTSSGGKQNQQQQNEENTTLSHCQQYSRGSRTSNDESSRLLLHLSSLAAFPWMLHRMLEDAEQQGFQDIVSWLPGDKGFIVHDQDRFMGNIAKSYFSQTHYKSFQRQLNIYGFQRITTSGPDKGGYTHEFLVRGKPEQCRFMVRTKIKGMGRTTKLSSMTRVPTRTTLCRVLGSPRKNSDEKEHTISTIKTAHPLSSSLTCSRIQDASPIRTIPHIQQFLSQQPSPLIPAEIADEIIAIFGTGGGLRRTTTCTRGY
jgi:hypothetical protein